jgi:tetratricopeptide (TPR) repeat protein
VQAILAKELYYGGDSQRGVQLGEEALARARAASDRRELARVLSFTTAVSPITALEEHAARVNELAALGEEFADPELRFRAANMRFIHAMHCGDREALDAALALMLTLAEAIAQPVLRWTTLWAQSARRWLDGDLEAAERLTMDAAIVARTHNIPEGLLITFGQLLAVRTEQDRLDELIEPLARQLEHNPALRLLRLTRGFVLAETGNVNEAAAVLADLAQDGFRFDFDRTRAFNLARCADIALRVGDLDAAPKLYEASLEYRRQFATPAGIASRGSIELNLGRLAGALGRYDDAEAHLEAALAAHRAFRAPLLEARTYLALGEVLAARGDGEPARDALDAALSIARSHGSTAVVREATGVAEKFAHISSVSASPALSRGRS